MHAGLIGYFPFKQLFFFGSLDSFGKMVDEKYSNEIAIIYKKLAKECVDELAKKLN